MSRRLEVFEHATLAVGAELTQTEFDALVAWNERFDGRYFRVGHRRLRAQHFVGIVQVGRLSIEIVPKADRDETSISRPWREGLLEMLRVAGGLALERLPEAAQRLAQRPLLELIARAYLVEVEALLREGLAKGYRAVEDNRAVFRGRLLVSKHVRANLARADRFYVEHAVFDHQVAINRVVLAALEVLARAALPPSLLSAIAGYVVRFPELATGGVDATACDRIQLGRATQRYSAALTYARLILSHQGPALRGGGERVFALLFNMNTLWERYVAVLVRRAVPPGFAVDTQDRLPFWATAPGTPRTVRPDIVVRDAAGQTCLVIDTKWKVADTPGDDDLKQMFVYNELLDCPRSLLLYPRSARSVERRGRYVGRGHVCAQVHVGVIDDAHWRSTPAMVEQVRCLLGVELSVPADVSALAGAAPPP